MKRFLSILITIGMICLSQSSIAQIGSASLIQPTSTKHIFVRNVPKVPKPKIFRSNPHRFHYVYIDDNDDTISVDDEDLMCPYRRQDLFKIVEVDFDDLPDHILNKLAAARKRAVEAYASKHFGKIFSCS